MKGLEYLNSMRVNTRVRADMPIHYDWRGADLTIDKGAVGVIRDVRNGGALVAVEWDAFGEPLWTSYDSITPVDA
jgi:hypothetical protein